MIAELEEVCIYTQFLEKTAIHLSGYPMQLFVFSGLVFILQIELHTQETTRRVTEVCDNEIHNSFVLLCRADKYFGTVSRLEHA